MWVILQEWIQGKGVFAGLKESDPANALSLSLFVLMISSLGARFAFEPLGGAAVSPSTENKGPSIKSDPVAFQRAKTTRELFDPKADPESGTMNFNDGRSPFGLKKNAEIWNGRIAMVRSWIWEQWSSSSFHFY